MSSPTPPTSRDQKDATAKASPPRSTPARRARVSPTHSVQARGAAAAILEVLAGQIGPQDAATSLGISVPRYYVLEQRALEAMVAGCEPRPRGPQRDPKQQAAELQRRIARLERDLARQQALARTLHRAAGLAAAPPAGSKAKVDGSGKRRRKPQLRALKMAVQLRQNNPAPQEPAEGPAVQAPAQNGAQNGG